MPRRYVFFCLLLFLPGTYLRAASFPPTCPDMIDVRQQLSSPVEGWSAGNDATPHRLASITFFDGPVGDNASLVYDSMSKAAGKDLATWRFAAGRPRAIWLSCGYAGTSVTLSRALPASITSCAVTYNPRQQVSGLPLVEKVSCR